jgi:hypothetical protein
MHFLKVLALLLLLTLNFHILTFTVYQLRPKVEDIMSLLTGRKNLPPMEKKAAVESKNLTKK